MFDWFRRSGVVLRRSQIDFSGRRMISVPAVKS